MPCKVPAAVNPTEQYCGYLSNIHLVSFCYVDSIWRVFPRCASGIGTLFFYLVYVFVLFLQKVCKRNSPQDIHSHSLQLILEYLWRLQNISMGIVMIQLLR